MAVHGRDGALRCDWYHGLACRNVTFGKGYFFYVVKDLLKFVQTDEAFFVRLVPAKRFLNLKVLFKSIFFMLCLVSDISQDFPVLIIRISQTDLRLERQQLIKVNIFTKIIVIFKSCQVDRWECGVVF